MDSSSIHTSKSYSVKLSIFATTGAFTLSSRRLLCHHCPFAIVLVDRLASDECGTRFSPAVRGFTIRIQTHVKSHTRGEMGKVSDEESFLLLPPYFAFTSQPISSFYPIQALSKTRHLSTHSSILRHTRPPTVELSSVPVCPASKWPFT